MPDTTPVRKFVALSSYQERRMGMGKVKANMSMSLDGFIAGPKDDEKPDRELEALESLHDWMFPPKGISQEIESEMFKNVGAAVMGRRMFNLGEEPWGDDPPFHMPVFVLTHQPRSNLIKEGGTTFTFITDGIESSLKQAKAAAGDKDVIVVGGANAIQQFLKAGLLDEIHLHLVPVLFGEGIRLFENAGAEHIELEKISVIEAPSVTHLRFRVVR
jgi:dihydrofolate reductase